MRILQLVTYPTRLVRHGGQARVANLRVALEAAGHAVETLAVYEPEHYGGDAIGPHDIAFPRDSRHRQSALPFCTDLASGLFAAEDDEAYARLRRLVVELTPEVVTLEQPWLLPLVERLRLDGAPEFSLVYSSQNIEAPLKREILGGFAPAEVDEVARRIHDCESRAALAADLVIACTEADAAVLRSYGARNVIVASNGIVERSVDPVALRDWQWHLRGGGHALFVGSAYPPNGAGFWDMMGVSLAFLPPDQRILAVGGVAGLLTSSMEYKRWEGINASRLVPAGFQTEEALAAMIALSSAIILPITRGGGSNIKTAEAILSGKPIVGTAKSFRGYEALLALPHIYVEDEPARFRSRLLALLAGPLPPAPPDDVALRRSVLWTRTLRDVPSAIMAAARDRAGATAARPAHPRTMT
jgi:hypothetical protein